MADKNTLPLPAVHEAIEGSHVHWFSRAGCVVDDADGTSRVFVGGSLIGTFAEHDTAARNAILVGLVGDCHVRKGKLAGAFGIGVETMRQIELLYERDGLAAVVARKHGGGHSKVTPQLRARLDKMFAAGMSVSEARAALGKRARVSRSTVGNVRKAWDTERKRAETAAPPEREDMRDDATLTLPFAETTAEPTSAPPAAEEKDGAKVNIADADPRGASMVQHAGTWLMMATVARLGVHRLADDLRGERVEGATLRMALDALIAALSLGEKCVEGVRRVATPTAAVLLRASRAPSASWVRRVLGRFSCDGADAHFLLRFGGSLAREAQAKSHEDEPVVFYVDNHLRPYTGQEVIRRGWRMQDKRVTPGATDYYVHDEDGRPVLSRVASDNAPLTAVLSPIAELLRMALGPEQRILLAFDRAGAFPVQMAELRERGFEFVTYERRPYPLLASTAFDSKMRLGDEDVRWCESRTNLGAGRGRVRRISLQLPDGHQINLLAVSEQPAASLASVMRGRWKQENGFKHGVERWGINQLDGRSVVEYPPDTVIPNPARRRLGRALRVACVREGDARNKLAALAADAPRRARLEQELRAAIELREQLKAQLPSTPKHAPLSETELADKLVHHTSEYKRTIDTVRIACANAEADLAGEIATRLLKPAEAKRVLRNLLAAPGRVRVGRSTLAVDLFPAATGNERTAMQALCAVVNRWRLALPGDARPRKLRFHVPE